MERRRAEREREIESDARDRQKEKEELEELKTKIFSEGHSDPTATLKQVTWFLVKITLFFLFVCTWMLHPFPRS